MERLADRGGGRRSVLAGAGAAVELAEPRLRAAAAATSKELGTGVLAPGGGGEPGAELRLGSSGCSPPTAAVPGGLAAELRATLRGGAGVTEWDRAVPKLLEELAA